MLLPRLQHVFYYGTLNGLLTFPSNSHLLQPTGLLMFRNLYISVQGFSFSNRILIYCINSLFASSGVLLVLSPVLLNVFATVPFAPLWLNALMTPLLAFFVLPVCVITLAISIIFLHSLPFSWLEVHAFTLANWVLEVWAEILQKLENENSYVLNASREWLLGDYIVYYTFLALLVWTIQWFTFSPMPEIRTFIKKQKRANILEMIYFFL